MTTNEYKCIYCFQEDDYKPFFCHECIGPSLEPLPTTPLQRVQNRLYMYDGSPVYWRGKILVCIHEVRRTTCHHLMCYKKKIHCIHEVPLTSPCEQCART
jgi:hypothetical protein